MNIAEAITQVVDARQRVECFELSMRHSHAPHMHQLLTQELKPLWRAIDRLVETGQATAMDAGNAGDQTIASGKTTHKHIGN